MPAIEQAPWTRLFENIGGAFSGLRRYEAAANLIGSTSYFAFVRRDEFDFFPDPGEQLKKVKNLLRAISYSADDDVLRLQVTEVTAGVTYTAEIVIFVGATPTTIATIAGTYGVDATVVPQVPLGPAGNIVLEAPSGTPGADEDVEIFIQTSAVRLSTDITGETEEEGLLEAAALESHQITASNFRGDLMVAARNRIVVNRLLQRLVGKFLGSDTLEVFSENPRTLPDGSRAIAPTGLLPELELFMKTNTPEQFLAAIVTTLVSETFDTTAETDEGVLTTTEKQPSAGTLRLTCKKGFEGSLEDPEEFEVVFLSSTFNRTITAAEKLRPFRSFDWLFGGFNLSLTRKVTNDDAFTRMANLVVQNANPSRVPNEQLRIEVGPYSGGVASYFRVVEPRTNWRQYTESNFADGAKEIRLNSGVILTFDWTNNAGATSASTFLVTLHPYRVGDVFERTISISGGRLNVELRRHFDYAILQVPVTPGTETIPDSVVAPELPFVEPFLGA